MTAQAFDFAVSPELQASLRKFRSAAWLLGVVGVVGLAAGWATSPVQFYRSYLWAYIFFVGISAGSLAWLMLQYLTGGAWGVVIRRPAEAAGRTLPLLLVLFVPIAIGIPSLYPWAHPDIVAADAILKHKQTFLNTPFFLLRAAIILGGWSFLGWFLSRWSDKEDAEGSLTPQRKMSRLSAPGLIFWGFAVTFLSIDWVMSLDAHWFSTMFGLLFVAGQGLSSMAFLITVLVRLSYRRPLSEVLTPRHLHDLGKLLLANVMVWAYFSFSQWLIVWAGNLPDEIPWYVERLRGGWQYVALVLVLGHFALPFALLLSRDLKRNFKLLSTITIFILCMRVVDVYWQVMPDASKGALALSWIDFAAFLGLGGIWMGYFLMQLEKRPLMPINAEDLVETWNMADNKDLQPRLPDLSDPNQRHEHADVNIWAIGKVGIGLILTTIVSLFLVLGVFRYLEQQDRASQPAPRPGAQAGQRQLPPQPRLLENEPEDLKQVRAAEDESLKGYGWTDPQHTHVRIPIDRAIDQLVQHGLPARPSGDQGAAASVSVPTESSLGPKMQQPGGPLAGQLAGSQNK